MVRQSAAKNISKINDVIHALDGVAGVGGRRDASSSANRRRRVNTGSVTRQTVRKCKKKVIKKKKVERLLRCALFRAELIKHCAQTTSTFAFYDFI